MIAEFGWSFGEAAPTLDAFFRRRGGIDHLLDRV
jgi:hypothetical protein